MSKTQKKLKSRNNHTQRNTNSSKHTKTSRNNNLNNKNIQFFDMSQNIPIVIKISPTHITYLQKKSNDTSNTRKYPAYTYTPTTKKLIPLKTQLTLGKWSQHTYKYEKLYILKSNGKLINEKQYLHKNNQNNYDNENLKADYIFYILVKINNKKYVSLGWLPFEFDIPDGDEILDISNIRTTRSGMQNITLFGRKNTYFIDDYNEYIGLNSYISNEDIKTYLPEYITSSGDIEHSLNLDNARDYNISHYVNNNGEGKDKGAYLIQKEKYYKKTLGIKIAHYKEKRIYNIIHYLKTKPLQ